MNAVIAALALLATALCSGCASATISGAPAKDLQANIAKLRLGMTPQEVVSLVGQPAANNRTITAEGTIYQWIYTRHSFTRKDVALIGGLAAANAGHTIPPSDHVLYVLFSNEEVIAIKNIQNPQ